MDICQLIVHSVHPIGGERRRRARGFGSGGPVLGLSSADWRGQLLGLGLSGNKVHHQDPLRLERRFALRQRVWLNHSSGLLVSKVTSS
jgi:hypothetical protein